MRSPSSLIFIVLLGVWAAYFVQYWIRRRDHLATARSVDQFTEAMRVLERRDTSPYADLSAPARPSYSVHPERSARPQVLVKRAAPAQASRAHEVSVPIDKLSAPVPDPTAGTRPSSTQHPIVPSASESRPRVRRSRRIRGLALLASLVALLLVTALVAFSVLPVWAVAPVLLAPVAVVVWIRSAVRAEQAAAQARRRRAVAVTRLRSTAAAPARGSASSSAVRGEVAAHTTTRPEVTHAELADVEVAEVALTDGEASPSQPCSGVVLDSAPADVVDAAPVAAPLVDEDDIPLTWDPVPVPRPTYTMKAKAERPDPAPAATTPAARPVELDDDRDYEPRQVAGA